LVHGCSGLARALLHGCSGLARTLLRGRSRFACALGWALATAAHAQLGGSVALDTDDRYRGVSLGDSKPSVRLTFNYDAPERWYAGASLRPARLAFVGTHTQLTGYAGWVAAPAAGRSFEVGVEATRFTGVSGYDYGEVYAGLLAERWSVRTYYSPDYYGRHVQTAYVEVNAHRPVAERARLFLHTGALVPLRGAVGDARRTRFDASAGAGVVVDGWDFYLALVAATSGGPYPAVYDGRRTTIVAGASFSF
jgi:uncharacterized protein (TIGR02001 family)